MSGPSTRGGGGGGSRGKGCVADSSSWSSVAAPRDPISFQVLAFDFLIFHAFTKTLPRHPSFTASMTKEVFSHLPSPPLKAIRWEIAVPWPAHQMPALFSWALPFKTGASQKRSGLLDMFSFPLDFGRNRFLLLQSIFNKHYGRREIPGCSPWELKRREANGGPAGTACQRVVCKNSGAGNVAE